MCSRRFAIARQCVKKNATTAAADRRAGKTGGLNSRRRAIGTPRVRGIETRGGRAAKPADADKAAPEKEGTFSKRERSVRAGPVSRVLFFRQPSILVRCCQRHRATFSRRNEQPHGLCLSCFGWGLQGPATLPPQRWALTPPFHPYRNAFGGLFLLHYPWSRLHRPLAGTLLCEARTFLTPTSATVQPTHIIQIIIKQLPLLVKP